MSADQAAKRPSGQYPPAAKDMSREDWDQLFTYVHTANQVRELIQRAIGEGKQQLSVQAPAIQEFLSVGSKADPAFWFKLGTLCGEQMKPQE